jgi:hypothetical protein
MHRLDAPASDSFMLWIDAVGGFWVCLADAVTLGQPTCAAPSHVAILADISTRHAQIRRDAEGYTIEAFRPLRVNGTSVTAVACLTDGSTVQLGETVRLRFRRPHPLSATARLEFVSSHRTQPACDAVVLMAESCVLGPHSHSHVVCRDWSQQIILYRHQGLLYCRSAGGLVIDGSECGQRGRLAFNSHVQCKGVSFSLEPLPG